MGERLSPYVSLCCVAMAVSVIPLFLYPVPFQLEATYESDKYMTGIFWCGCGCGCTLWYSVTDDMECHRSKSSSDNSVVQTTRQDSGSSSCQSLRGVIIILAKPILTCRHSSDQKDFVKVQVPSSCPEQGREHCDPSPLLQGHNHHWATIG